MFSITSHENASAVEEDIGHRQVSRFRGGTGKAQLHTSSRSVASPFEASCTYAYAT